MKLQGITIKNVKSFRDEIEFVFDEKFNILIGPNGSGKSNLLDIITISLRGFFLQTYAINEGPPGMTQLATKTINQSSNIDQLRKQLEKHIDNIDKPMLLKFSFIINNEDIENIKLLKINEKLLSETLSKQFSGSQHVLQQFQLSDWNPDEFHSGDILKYEIDNYLIKGFQNNMYPHPPMDNVNSETQISSKEKTFLKYLNFFELALILLNDSDELKLNPNFLFFGPYRNISSEQSLQANLSSQTFNQLLQEAHTANSKKNTSLINIASIYFSDKRRKYERDASLIGYKKLWDDDKEVKLMSEYLGKLGYEWDLATINSNRNIYEIQLMRDGQVLLLSQASSGEKELINYLLGIFALNLENGLIIIDEPELHLHPQWQNLLLDLFYDLSNKTGNQFVISTHSSIFIKEKSLKHLTRLYKEDESSNAVFLKHDSSLKIKDLLHIINSTNNEKIFFADFVVLVEGLTDRIVFQKILSEIINDNKILKVVEVVDIGGKNNKDKFSNFLNSLRIPHSFIADLDYVNEVGNEGIKKLFIVNKVKVEKEAIKSKSSRDAITLLDKLEVAVLNNSIEDLKKFIEYMKSSRKKLKSELKNEEKLMIRNFIEEQKGQNVYLLEKGDIEDYFPDKSNSKDLENVISLLSQVNYDKWKNTPEYKELKKIAEEILTKIN